MKLNIQKLKENDYEKLLVNWWKDWGWQAPPKDFLPDNGAGGFMVYNKDIPICAGFIYKSNSKVVDHIYTEKIQSQNLSLNDNQNKVINLKT